MSLRIAAFTALLCVSAPAASVASSTPPHIEADEAAAWCDAVFAPMLTHHRYTGLAVVVVLDGRVLITKAYGYADAARKTALLPERTRLRIGSITKSMTATIILQLLDEGRIRSLDDPANDYLRRFKLPDYHGKPVTLRHLLTHTAGFEAYLLGLGTEHAAKAPADTAYIRQVTPRQVRAPGGQPIYSNFGFEALGAIVEDLTGQTMAEVLSQRLFEPLGMDGSALPYALRPSPELGQPYAFFPNGELQPVPYVALHPFASAAGGVEATPMDMARYMIAQLDEDAAARTILAPRLLREMHARQAGANGSVPGPGLGVFVADRDGVRIVEHPGHWPGFHNLMTLVPEWKLGFFVSAMAQAPVPSFGETLWGSARLRASTKPAAEPALSLYDLYEVREAFLNRFAGARAPVSAAVDARPMVGRYRAAERSHTSPEAVLDFLGGATVVRLARLDAIEVDGAGPYHAIAPDSFARVAAPSASPSGLDRYGFVRDAAGSVAYMVDGTGYSVAEPIGVLQSPQLWRRYVMAVALLCLSAIALVLRGEAIGAISRAMPWLPLVLLLCLCTQALVVLAGYDPARYLVFDVLAGRSARLAMLVLLGDVMLVLVLAIGLAAGIAWRLRWWGTSRWGCAARVHFSAIAASALGLLPLLWSLNLVGVP